MTKIIMNGCNGKMGQVITRLVSEDNECEIVAGFDVNDSIENTYPVFTNPDEFTGDRCYNRLFTPICSYNCTKLLQKEKITCYSCYNRLY